MDAPQPQRTKIDTASTHDYITNLPGNVKEEILLKLPIKEAVRTSILSTKWVDAWISIPNLVFRGNCTKSELINRVDMVLLAHQGPIQKFELFGCHDCSEAIGRWLLVLSRNGIKDLRLRCFKRNVYSEIPSRLISCTVLEHLDLCYCSINIPPFFQGFKQLRSLHLSCCNLPGIILEKMISSCPLLDNLALYSLWQGRLHIRASNLTSLDMIDKCFDICLETPKLASTRIYFVPDSGNHQILSAARDTTESNITRVLGRLLNIQTLNIQGEFLQYLAAGPIPENLPPIFNHLTYVSVELYVKPNEVPAALCIFENAPNLETLFMQFRTSNYQPSDHDASWESKAIQDHLFRKLKIVDIFCQFQIKFCLKITNSLLGFARLVLSTAPVLEKLKFYRLKDAVVIFEMLKWFPRLSKNAQLAFT